MLYNVVIVCTLCQKILQVLFMGGDLELIRLLRWGPWNFFVFIDNSLHHLTVRAPDSIFILSYRFDVTWDMSLSNIRADDRNGMLVGRISCFPRSHRSSHHEKLILCGTLCVLIIDRSPTLSHTRSLACQIVHRSHIRYLLGIHPLSYRQLPHLNFDSLLVFHFFHFLQSNCLILFSLLLIDLFLESYLHGKLLLLSFVLHDAFLVSALGEDITVPLQLHIDSIFIYASSSLNVGEVLFGDTGVEVLVVVRISVLSCVLRDVKGFVVESVGIVLVIGRITW